MNISEFLASMQTDPNSRALARNTQVQAGIPDVDNDPSTQDASMAAPDQQQQQDDDNAPPDMSQPDPSQDPSQGSDTTSFADGGEVPDTSGEAFAGASTDGDKTLPSNYDRRLPDQKESENVEDRASGPKISENRQGWRNVADRAKRLISGDYGPHQNYPGSGRDDIKFEDGGEVPDEEQSPAPEPQEGAGDPSGNMGGGIPTDGDEQPQPQQRPPGQRARAKEFSNDMEGWRANAMDAVSAGLEYGLSKVKQGLGGAEDPVYRKAVEGHLKGEGAVDPKQWDQALESVDPSGQMDAPTRNLKAIGALYEFYKQAGGDDTPHGDIQAAAAAHSVQQHWRKQANALAAHATVADDQGVFPAAAKAASDWFNKSGSGLITTIVPGGDQGMSLEGAPDPMDRDAATQSWEKVGPRLSGKRRPTSQIGQGDPGMDMGGDAGIPEPSGPNDQPALPPPGKSDVMANNPTGPGNSAAQPAPPQAGAIPPAGSPVGGGANPAVPKAIPGSFSPGSKPGTMAATVTDPETGKTVWQGDLTSEQLKHALADGFDKLIHHGPVSVLENASQVTEGHKHLAGPQQRPQDMGATPINDSRQVRPINKQGAYTDEQNGQRTSPRGTWRGEGAPPGGGNINRKFDGSGAYDFSQERNPDLPPGYVSPDTHGQPPVVQNQFGWRQREDVSRKEQGAVEHQQRDLASKEKINASNQAGNTTRENIRAGNDPTTGRPQEGGGPSGKGAARDSNLETQAQKAAKVEFDNLTAAGKPADWEQLLDKYRAKFNTYGVRQQGGGQQQPQQSPQPSAQNAQKAPPAPPGWKYVANPKTKQWEAVRVSQ